MRPIDVFRQMAPSLKVVEVLDGEHIGAVARPEFL
jgi:hypothetical protein